jgi:hypothetical protein
MFISPYFGGCKYTNYFLFINKNIEFQRLVLLITSPLQDFFRQKEQQKPKPATAPSTGSGSVSPSYDHFRD